MLSVQLAVLAVLAFCAYRLFLLPLLNPLRDLPTAKQPPFYKRLLVEPSPEQLQHWSRTIPNDGFIRYRGAFNKERLLVTNPRGQHDIFMQQPYSFIHPPAVAKIVRSLLGDGLVTVEGDAHKTQKRAVQPAFKVQRIQNLRPTFEHKADELVQVMASDLKEHDSQKHSFNIAPYIHRVTLDLIGIAGLGLDFDCLKDPTNRLVTDYQRGFTPSKDAQRWRMLAIIFPDWILNRLPLRRNQEIRSSVGTVKEYARAAITKRLNSGKAENDATDIIGVLMAEGHVLDVETLVNQSTTLLGAGHDTVSGGLASSVFALSKRPQIQSRLREEIAQVMEADEPDIDNLPYLSAVINEVLRFHPPIPGLFRDSIEPVTVLGRNMPKGTNFMTSMKIMNRSEQFWKSDPEVFDPDRWLNDPSGGAKDRLAFSSFGHGVRSCIGERFARAEMKHVLAGIVKNFEFSFVGTGLDGKAQEMLIEHGTVSRLVGGLWLDMKYLGDS